MIQKSFSKSVILSFFLLTVNLIFAAGVKTYPIEQFGAVNDGKTLNTKAIQKAIDEVSANNGGILVFSKGSYLTGHLILKSNINLQFDEGSVLLGSINPEDYKIYNHADSPQSPKEDDNAKQALLLAHKVKNISITGKGTIDGRGRELALYVDSLHHKGIKIDEKYNVRRNRPSELARPKIINFSECDNVVVKGVTVKNSSGWVQTYEMCNNLTIDGITVVSRAFWNNDGMDVTDCHNVRIVNCNVDAADDGICLKSYYPGHYGDSIYIANCTVRSSANAVKFGTASWGGFKNVVIENIKVIDTYRSCIAIESVDGGFIENVKVSNIIGVNTGNAIFIKLGHRAGDKPGVVKNISLKNIKVQVPFGRPDEAYDMRGPDLPFQHNTFPSSITGIPGYYVENVSLENIEITYPGRASKGLAYIPLWRLETVKENIGGYPEFSMFGELPSWGLYVRHVKGISFKNIKLKLKNEDFRPAFVFDDVKGIDMQNISIPTDKTENIIFKDTEKEKLDISSSKFVKELK